MSNQSQSPTLEKRVVWKEKSVKSYLQQNNLLDRQPQVLKIGTKNNSKNDICDPFSTKPHSL